MGCNNNRHKCGDFKDGGIPNTDFDKYCYESRIDSQSFCFGKDNGHKFTCTDVGGGIRLVYGPLRFMKVGQARDSSYGLCQNYHPEYLQNLAWSLGYSNHRVVSKRSNNWCPLAFLDSTGNFQTIPGNGSLELPANVRFWGTVSR